MCTFCLGLTVGKFDDCEVDFTQILAGCESPDITSTSDSRCIQQANSAAEDQSPWSTEQPVCPSRQKQ